MFISLIFDFGKYHIFTGFNKNVNRKNMTTKIMKKKSISNIGVRSEHIYSELYNWIELNHKMNFG